MKSKALETIQRCHLLMPGTAVIAAVSGGADSMALLFFLHEIQAEYRLKLSAAHINHGLRGAEADRDEALVRATCARLGVPFFVLHADVAGEAKRSGEGIEACGRRIRYAYLESLDDQALIATAHTLDDQLETFLMHFARGAGLHGLCGILARRGRIIRPLIDCTREQVEAYCRERQIPYIIDSTNLSREYTRNRVRMDLVPALRALNPQLHEAARRCFSALQADESLLEELTSDAMRSVQTPSGYEAAAFLCLPKALRARLLETVLRREGCPEPSSLHIHQVEALLEQGSGQVQVGGGLLVRLRRGMLEFPQAGHQHGAFSLSVSPPQWPEQQFFEMWEEKLGVSLVVHKKDFIKIQKIHKHQLANCLDYDKIHDNLILRSRGPGDRLRPIGRGCSKTFKNLFQEMGIPPEKRGGMPVLCDTEGPVWAPFFGADERVAVRAESVRFLLITIGGKCNAE